MSVLRYDVRLVEGISMNPMQNTWQLSRLVHTSQFFLSITTYMTITQDRGGPPFENA